MTLFVGQGHKIGSFPQMYKGTKHFQSINFITDFKKIIISSFYDYENVYLTENWPRAISTLYVSAQKRPMALSTFVRLTLNYTALNIIYKYSLQN